MELSTKITLNEDSFLRLIKFILVLLANQFLHSCSLDFFQIESAHSSSSSCCAASLFWSKGLVPCQDVLTTAGGGIVLDREWFWLLAAKYVSKSTTHVFPSKIVFVTESFVY
jgi:hypothetical protein